ncbi:hypothetical protein GQ54DRAFT_139132 [Martensiomyces pterosporus]|nr:hypothetical protein GQ54DRAFT_139132 [Martensiomyces pterosporus]
MHSVSAAAAASNVRRVSKSLLRSVKKMQPNYFLSVRLDNTALQEQISKFYSHVHDNHPEWRRYVVKPAQSHLTLGVMHLGSPPAVNGARGVLESSSDLVTKYLPQTPTIGFKGIGVFGSNRIVYMAAQDIPSEFVRFVQALRLRFWSSGFPESPLKAPPHNSLFLGNEVPNGVLQETAGGKVDKWMPHATLMKIRGTDLARLKRQANGPHQPTSKRRGSLVDTSGRQMAFSDHFGIPSATYEPFKDHAFGSQRVYRIELASMLLPKDKSGYYQCAGALDIEI